MSPCVNRVVQVCKSTMEKPILSLLGAVPFASLAKDIAPPNGGGKTVSEAVKANDPAVEDKVRWRKV